MELFIIVNTTLINVFDMDRRYGREVRLRLRDRIVVGKGIRDVGLCDVWNHGLSFTSFCNMRERSSPLTVGVDATCQDVRRVLCLPLLSM